MKRRKHPASKNPPPKLCAWVVGVVGRNPQATCLEEVVPGEDLCEAHLERLKQYRSLLNRSREGLDEGPVQR